MRILIAVDDDDASREALRFAERLVSADDEVLVLNVTRGFVPYVADPFGGFGMVATDPEVLVQVEEHAHQVVQEASEQLDDVVWAEPVIDYGSPGERICAAAADRGTELIVLGSHDRGAFSRFLHGSVSDYVLHHAPCPVLVVKNPPGADDDGHPQPRRPAADLSP